MSTFPTVTVPLTDLLALTEVAEAFMSEAGEYAVSRYADPSQVVQAVANAKTAIRNVERHSGPTEPTLTPFQAWRSGRRAHESTPGTVTTVAGR